MLKLSSGRSSSDPPVSESPGTRWPGGRRRGGRGRSDHRIPGSESGPGPGDSDSAWLARAATASLATESPSHCGRPLMPCGQCSCAGGGAGGAAAGARPAGLGVRLGHRHGNESTLNLKPERQLGLQCAPLLGPGPAAAGPASLSLSRSRRRAARAGGRRIAGPGGGPGRMYHLVRIK